MNKLNFFLILSLLAGSYYTWRHKTMADLDKAIGDDVLIVGTNADYPPFAFVKDGEIVGFEIDLINEVAKRMKKTTRLIDMPFSALIPKLQTGGIEIIAAGMAPTPQRAKRALFTRPHIFGEPLYIVTLAERTPLTTITQLKDTTVIVNDGFTADYYVSALPNVTPLRLGTSAEALLALQAGRGESFITAASALEPFFATRDKQSFVMTPIPDTEEQSAFAVSQRYPELLTHIQRAMDEVENDGTLADLKQKWNV